MARNGNFSKNDQAHFLFIVIKIAIKGPKPDQGMLA
jgi:hypothetical protein